MKIIGILLAVFFSFIIGSIISAVLITNFLMAKAVSYKMFSDKHLQIMDVFKSWLIMLESGKKIDAYFSQNGYKTIAIYGMGYLGERLLAELEETDIEVKYVIEQKKNAVYGGTPVCSLDDDLELVDVVVITPTSYYYSIREQLREKLDCVFISVEEIFK